jgi:xanthine/uracil permease
VNQWKWVNQFQPQTLYMATILCYVDAVFGLLFGSIATSLLAGLVTIALLAAGGNGIANEKKWGYAVAVGGAVLQVVMLFAVFGIGVLTSTAIISLLFDGALVALLLHPMSREYQRIWFK